MSMSAPQSDIRLPAELEKAIERSRNVVTINESEAARLGELIVSREYEIREQQKQIADLGERILMLQKKEKELEGAVAELDQEILALNATKFETTNEYNLVRGSLASLRDFLAKV